MKPLLRCQSTIGPFYICQSRDGYFHPVYDDESLGAYSSVTAAVEALAFNETFSVVDPESLELVDTSAISIPSDPRAWIKIW